MFKTLFFTLLLLPLSAAAMVELRWLSGSSILLDDGSTKILFDAAYTRPTWRHWLNLDPFASEEKTVQKVVADNELDNLQAIFVTHSHFDHVVDAPTVARLTKAIFYVDEHMRTISLAYRDPRIKTLPLMSQKPHLIGNFRVTPFPGDHSQLLGFFSFLPGAIMKDFNFDFYDYHEGQCWTYVVEHAERTIVIAHSPEEPLPSVLKLIPKADVVVQSIAGRGSDEAVLHGYVEKLKATHFIPNHFDNFFMDFDPAAMTDLPGVDVQGLVDEMKKASPTLRVTRPSYGKRIEL